MNNVVDTIRTAGMNRRAELERLADQKTGADTLFQAVFFNNIDQLWADIQMAFSAVVQAYNRAGRFMDLKFSQSADEIVVRRDHAPDFHLTVSLWRDAREVVVDVASDRLPAVAAKRMEVGIAPSADGVSFYYDGTIEDPLTTAIRVLRPYL